MISIIAPVYKIEPFLRQGLDSVVNQTFTDWELIIVDDGSPDNCPAICDEYAKNDDRITVVHQENQGVVAARGTGIKAARGDYIMHFDPDDLLEPFALEKIAEAIEKTHCDMIIFPTRLMEEPEREIRANGLEGDQIYARDDIITPFLDYVAIWNKVVRADIAKEANRDYPERISIKEDQLRLIPLACRVENAYNMKDVLHTYRQEGGGMHKLCSWKEIQDCNAVTGYVLKELEDFHQLTEARERHLIHSYLVFTHRVFRKLLSNKAIKTEQLRELRSHPVFQRALPFATADFIGLKRAVWIRLISIGRKDK